MTEILALLLLLVLSGIFSGSETALVALSLARAQALMREGRSGAKTLYYLKTNPSKMLITILIGNNVVNISASAIATVVATEWLGHIGPGVAVGVLTFLILIFGEITPKSLATRYSERISLVIAPIMYGLMKLMYPLVWLFGHFTSLVHRLTGADADPIVTESELISMVEHGEEEGVIEADEREIIERVFHLNDLKASDVMTPARQVFSLDGRRKLAETLPEIAQTTFSRIPLYGEDASEILQVLYVRDVLEAIASGETEATIGSIARSALFVAENQKLDQLIPMLRSKKQHLAVVVNEHGYMEGVVTLEDILEELVGEIYDESDVQPDEYRELEDASILVDGTTELRVVEQYFEIDLPGKPTNTVNRWILDHTERIPLVDESFSLDGLKVTVQEASSRRIHQVMLTRT